MSATEKRLKGPPARDADREFADSVPPPATNTYRATHKPEENR